MAKKNSKDETYIIKKKNGDGKGIKVKKSDITNSEKYAKRAIKKVHKKYRWIVASVLILAVIGFTLFYDIKIMPLEYVFAPLDVPSVSGKAENSLRVHFVDVGQGDAIIIEFPDKKNMIIDGGDRGNEERNQILGYIKGLNIKTFDYMMLTHSDSDHVGSLDDVVKFTEVKKVFMPDIKSPKSISSTYDTFVEAVKKEKSEIEISNLGDKILSTDSNNDFAITLLSPTDKQYIELNKPNPTAEEKNDVSPLMILSFMDKKIMFTGDANDTVERDVLDFYKNEPDPVEKDEKFLDVDILKAGHHGSGGSSCQEFLDALTPSSVIISAGLNNKYGHPHKEALDRFNKANSDIYRTDLNGDIVVTLSPIADGKCEIKIEKQKMETKNTDRIALNKILENQVAYFKNEVA